MPVFSRERPYCRAAQGVLMSSAYVAARKRRAILMSKGAKFHCDDAVDKAKEHSPNIHGCEQGLRSAGTVSRIIAVHLNETQAESTSK